MQHPTGRHHRRCRSLTEHLWALFALTMASALAYLFIPHPPARTAIGPAPRRTALQCDPARRQRMDDFPSPSIRVAAAQDVSQRWEDDHLDPDRIAGALVRPYLVPLPRPRTPVGDLLAGPGTDEFDDLTEAIRTYLRVCGRP